MVCAVQINAHDHHTLAHLVVRRYCRGDGSKGFGQYRASPAVQQAVGLSVSFHGHRGANGSSAF